MYSITTPQTVHSTLDSAPTMPYNGLVQHQTKMSTQDQIYKILLPIKQQTLNKIKENMSKKKEDLHILKVVVPEICVYGTFERTFSTCLGHKLQEIAAVCGEKTINIDKAEGKVLGIDIRTEFGEGQMKTGKNTQTGTHKKDSLNKLLETTENNQTNPFFATALGESYDYVKNGILYIGGAAFWKKIGIEYNMVYDTIVRVAQETYEEVKFTFLTV